MLPNIKVADGVEAPAFVKKTGDFPAFWQKR